MKKLFALLFLMTICCFSACEQVNPQANAVAGTNVQVTQGDPAASDDDDDNDNDNNNNNDDDNDGN